MKIETKITEAVTAIVEELYGHCWKCGYTGKLSSIIRKYGNAETTSLVDRLRGEMNRVIALRDVELAKDLYDQMWHLDYQIAEVDFYIVWIMQWNSEFSSKKWSNPGRARELVDKGMRIISGQPTADALRPIAFELRDMLPDYQRPDSTLVHQ